MNDKLEQDLRLLKKIHDEQFEQHIQSTAVNVDQFQSEIRALKRVCDDKTDEVSLRIFKAKVNFLRLVSSTIVRTSFMSRSTRC